MKKLNKGFTLIELLVVIAIIGILSSVVLASLNTARGKGADAAIKSQLNSLRAESALYYDNNNTYVGFLFATTTPTNTGYRILAAATSSAATNLTWVAPLTGTPTATAGAFTASSTGWVAYVPLKSSATASYFCVDSNGNAATLSAVPTATWHTTGCQ